MVISRKKVIGVITLLLLILVVGCSLKIDIDPSKLGETETTESQR